MITSRNRHPRPESRKLDSPTSRRTTRQRCIWPRTDSDNEQRRGAKRCRQEADARAPKESALQHQITEMATGLAHCRRPRAKWASANRRSIVQGPQAEAAEVKPMLRTGTSVKSDEKPRSQWLPVPAEPPAPAALPAEPCATCNGEPESEGAQGNNCDWPSNSASCFDRPFRIPD